MKTARTLVVAIAVLWSFAVGATQMPQVVDTESGKIKGAVHEDVLAFKGVPFAAPPVGALRWRAPQPAARWTGVRPANDYGHDCMQVPFRGDAAPLGTGPSEDCLVLNVWRPAQSTAAKLPVMVWIYGGGFVNGGASPAVYDGSQFAKQGVILVSFNYRLGRFGFFAHPALSKAVPADEPLGNYAYMDQIAALRWVQRNIAHFGGDPHNVTVFGELAGGGSVHMLLSSPMARGLFARAIVESGGGRGPLLPFMRKLRDDIPGYVSAEAIGIAFAKSKGISGDGPEALAALRALPADAVLGGMNLATMRDSIDTFVGGPVLDGRIVIETQDAAYRAGNNAKVPVMSGANDADIGLPAWATVDDIFASFGARAADARQAYDPSGTGTVASIGAAVAMDRLMVEPARLTAQLFAQQGLPAYEYRFSYVATSLRSTGKGAQHASEIPFVFDTVRAKYGDKLSAEDFATAKAMSAYWVNFAKTGNPNGPGLPDWPRYDPAKDQIMDFALTGPGAKPDPWKTRLDLAATPAR